MEGEEVVKPIQSTCVEVETTTDENGENVQVYYLDVPDSEDPQVLDISNITNILSQEGIQIVEADGALTQVSAADAQTSKAFHDNIILELEPDGTICRDQSAAQSAEALLNLAKSHGGPSQQIGSSLKVVDILDVNTQVSTEGDLVETEQVSEPVTATYVLDENGTMVPLSEYRETSHGSNLFEVEGPSAQTVAACTCWCGKEFLSQEELDKHQLTHNKSRLRGSACIKCDLCSQVFNTSSKLASHHRVAHPDGMPWECPICFRRFSKKLGLKVHLRAHSGLKQHKCSYCDRSFSYKNALLRHIRLHTKDKPYKCTICGEAFAHLWSMRRHRAIHKPKHLFQCDICSKTFKQKTTLYIHARIHTGQRPYSCEICRKSFTLKSSLNQHLRIHTGERPKVCPICEKAFRQTSTLRSHMNLHNHVKPHKCRYCRQRFSTPEEAHEHESIHISNKSWQCDECGMRFKNQSLLARHVRKHTNERPFQCKICGKSFCQSGSLQSHMRTHTKEKPYQCRLCPKTYTTSGTLLLHIRRAHNLDAKSVKDVFPSTSYVEDQKVFTIPTPLRNNTTINTAVSGGEDGNESVMSDVLGGEGLVFEEVIGGSQVEEGLTQEDTDIIIQRINPLSKDVSGEQQEPSESGQESSPTKSVKEGVDDSDEGKGNTTDTSEGVKKQGVYKNMNVKDLMRKRHIKSGSLTLMNVDSGQYKIIDTEKENSLYAQARQEAALGLAELSLVGGVVVSEKKPGTAYRTLARGSSDLDSSVDPSVTKIILSKEGGVMNSQDPHQCPDCKRIFGRKSIMVEHRRIHTDEKPYKCDFCPGEFRQSAQLTCHILNKHTKDKLYHCTFCQKKFLSRSITIRHINFHHKLKLRVCERMCPGWKIDDAIFVEKREILEPAIIQGGRLKGRYRRNMKFGKKSDITILNSLAGLGSPTVKVKFGTDKKKVSLRSSATNEPTIEYCTNENVSETSTLGSKSGQQLQLQLSQQPFIKSEEPESQEELEESEETVIGTWYVCETCAMQFNTMNSLRWHLGQVHNTTLAESDVSYVFEDEPVGNVTKEPSMLDTPVAPSAGEELSSDTSVVVESTDKPVPVQDVVVQEGNKNYVVVTKGLSENISYISNKDTPVSVGERRGATTISIKSSLRCSLCSLYFGCRTELEQHMMTHNDEEVSLAGLHRCDTCGVVMKNTQQITKHILKVHGVENIYGCSICDKEFFQESSVLRHIKFFHKWEMKIRGEGNIPVLLKPASEHLKVPGAADKDKIKGKVREVKNEVDATPGKKSPQNDVKVTSRYENDMTFISLEVGDLDHLQLYREDGQEVRFEVVSSTDKATVIRIKDPQNKRDSSNVPIIIEEAETTVIDKPQGEKVTAEIINCEEDNVADVLSETCEDLKVSLVESPSKLVVTQDMSLVQESDEIERTPKVVVMKEQGVVPAMQDKTEDVIDNSFGHQNEISQKIVSEVKIESSPSNAHNEKNEREVIVEEEKSNIQTVLVSSSPITSEQKCTIVCNVSQSPDKSNASNVKCLTVNSSKDSNPEVIVVEKNTSGRASSNNQAKTPATKNVTTGNCKVRTISVLNKSPSDIVGTSKNISLMKKAVVNIEQLNVNTRNSSHNPQRYKDKRAETILGHDKTDDVQVPKRGRPSRAATPSTPAKPIDTSKALIVENRALKSQIVSKLKHDPTVTVTTPKQNEKLVSQSQSRSGRVIKRKKFADEDFETKTRKHQK